MKNTIFYFFCICALISCNSNTIPKKPDNLLSKQKMASVLAESYIAKNAKNIKNKNNERNINYLSLVYINQETDSTTFNKSLKYYTSNINLNEEIMKLVKTLVDNKLNILKNKKEVIFTRKIDSLKKSQQNLINQEIKSLKDTKEIILIRITDSIINGNDKLFEKQTKDIQNRLKDTLRIKSFAHIEAYKQSLQNDIDSILEIKNSMIKYEIEKKNSKYQKQVDLKIEAIQKENKDETLRKMRELERKKYK